MKHLMATLILSAIGANAVAQPMPGPGPGMPPAPPMMGRLSPEALATVPDTTAAQQVELRKILVERRDAHEAVEAKARAERDALAKKDRAEHERIDNESAERLRKLLGDDGYRRFAEWQFAHHGPPHGPAGGPPHGGGPVPGPGKMSLLPEPADGDDD